MTYLQHSPKNTLPLLQKKFDNHEKIVALSLYEALFAHVAEQQGVELLLVGDSLGMVFQGQDSTLQVTMEQMLYHCQAVARGKGSALVAADMPFASYYDKETAYKNASQLIQAGAEIVKIEGGVWTAPIIEFLTQRSIPVWAHIGLMPQNIHLMGGYKVQGKSDNDVERLKNEARTLYNAGAKMLLLEAVPSATAKEVITQIPIPTIGIGAGVDVGGQVLVLHDLLGLYPSKKPRFVRDFLAGTNSVSAAIQTYVTAVKNQTFPNPEEAF